MNEKCPASELLKALNGKWKAQIFKMASEGSSAFQSNIESLARCQ